MSVLRYQEWDRRVVGPSSRTLPHRRTRSRVGLGILVRKREICKAACWTKLLGGSVFLLQEKVYCGSTLTHRVFTPRGESDNREVGPLFVLPDETRTGHLCLTCSVRSLPRTRVSDGQTTFSLLMTTTKYSSMSFHTPPVN